jgi:hypothetical protein
LGHGSFALGCPLQIFTRRNTENSRSFTENKIASPPKSP